MMRRNVRQAGFLLLEVVVAIGLLVFGLALLGSRLHRSQALTYETDELSRVVFLAESKLAELDTGLLTPEQEIRSDFGKLFPRYGWRMRIMPTTGSAGSLVSAMQGDSTGADLGMFFVELEILFDPARDPEQEFDFESAQVMQRYYTLRAPPRSLDLTADFGLEDDLAQQVNEDLTNAGVNGLDVHDFDPSIFRDMDLEQLKEVLPIFMQAFGLSASQFLDMLPEEMRGTVQAWLDSLPDDGSESGDGSGDGGSGDGTSGGGGGAGGAGGGSDGASGGAPGEGGQRAGRGGKDVGRRGDRPDRGADDAGDNAGGDDRGGANDGGPGGFDADGRGGGDPDAGSTDGGTDDDNPRRGGRRGPRGGGREGGGR